MPTCMGRLVPSAGSCCQEANAKANLLYMLHVSGCRAEEQCCVTRRASARLTALCGWVAALYFQKKAAGLLLDPLSHICQ
jgi:hypothetical protein